MWIRDVEFPRGLIEAHRGRKLVVFVGAGVSRDAPSNLPDFRRLTEAILAETQQTATEDELANPDVLLGRLERQGVDVHRRVATRIGALKSSPNRLHEAIVDLAAANSSVRIVTTNYDLHLSAVLAARGLKLPEYAGPALPVGDDFTGIVYIHGNLKQDSTQLVVTDKDFGRAYLTDAWAARFLERMFAKFTVLFVGYSHGDVVMRYLGRALGPTSPRYVLTASSDMSYWSPLDIHPIVYPVVGSSHAGLVDSVERWAVQASMGLLDHQQEVARLVAAAPSSIPEENSYLEEVIADSERVGLFADSAKGEEWLTWASGQPEFRLLFSSSVAPTDCTHFLAQWFAREFAAVEAHASAALAIVRDSGGQLGATVWHAIAFHIRRISPRPAWCNPWFLLLIENVPEHTADALDYALSDSRWPEDRELAILLFDHLTEPHAVADRFHFGAAHHLRVGLQGSPHWLDQSWKQVFQPNLEEAATELMPIVDRHFRRAHQLQVAAGAADSQWDPLSYGRSAIEPNPQNHIPGAIDVLIDAARDCLEALLNVNDAYGVALLESWSNSGQPLLQRLALHGWVHQNDVDATAKMTWLQSRNWLWAHQLRHEVFSLIAAALPAADVAVADALVAQAESGDGGESDPERKAYLTFNLLSWIVDHAPELASAKNALDRILANHPDFKIGPHPDLISWHSGGAMASHPPMTPEQLHQRIASGESDVIVELRAFEGVDTSFDGSSWQDAVNVIAQAVRGDPADGLALLADPSSHSPKFISAVVWGWMDADVDDQVVDAIVVQLGQLDLAPMVGEVARLLADAAHGSSGITAWHRSTSARELAMVLWNLIEPDDPGNSPSGHWLDRGIGHPAGQIALFWVRAIAADWSAQPEGWGGLTAPTRESLEVLLNSGDTRSAMAEVILASQLLFFFATDENWCLDHVLPMLDWDTPERAQRAWEGYLVWGRWNDKLLAAGLRDRYRSTLEHLGDLRDEMHERFCAHLAGIAVYAEADPSPLLQAFTARASEADSVGWITEVSVQLDQVPVDAVENLWDKWMRSYWQGWLQSVPRTMTVGEAAALALWTVHLSSSVEEGVGLALAHDGAVGEHSNLLRLLDGERLGKAPTPFARLIAHLLKGNEPPFYGDHHLHGIVMKLKGKIPNNEITPIIEQAVRLHFLDAPNW
jgi:hypothetical protein